MAIDLQLTGTYTLITCCSCDLSFGVPTTWKQRKRADHSGFNCPNGCSLVFNGESEAQKLARQLKYAEASASAARDQAAAAERSARAYKGVATRVRRRAAHGVCPAGCKRTFADVARHMAGQHPEFVAEHGGQS